MNIYDYIVVGLFTMIFVGMMFLTQLMIILGA